MIDELLDYGCTFDWISPVLAMGHDLANGGGHTLFINQGCGWTGGELADLLHANGIKTWGHMIVNGQIMITVHPDNGEWAENIIDEAFEADRLEEVLDECAGTGSAWDQLSPFSGAT